MDEISAFFHTQYILTGVAGAFLHALHDRKLDPREVARYIAAGAVLSNFVGPLALVLATTVLRLDSIPEGAGNVVGFVLGYVVFRLCRFLDRYLDKELKPLEGPEHE